MPSLASNWFGEGLENGGKWTNKLNVDSECISSPFFYGDFSQNTMNLLNYVFILNLTPHFPLSTARA